MRLQDPHTLAPRRFLGSHVTRRHCGRPAPVASRPLDPGAVQHSPIRHLFPIIVTCLMRDLRNGATEKASLVRISLMQRIIAPEIENNFFPLSNGRREVLDAAKGGGWWRSNAVPVGALATLIAYADGAPAI